MNSQDRMSSILIVDDVIDNLRILGTILQKEKYQVIAATNGQEALDMAKEYTPDLILLDIMMPGMDGYQVAETLKSSPTTLEIPIIFLTAKTEEVDIIKGFDAGGVDYIKKPFNFKELVSRVRTHLDLKHTKEQLLNIITHKNKMFSIIAHDLRGPISTFRDGIKLILDNTIDEADKEPFLSELFSSAGNTYELLENLLFWSRSQMNELKIKPERFNISNVVSKTIQVLKSISNGKIISIHENLIHAFVYADKDMVTTTIRNLISNAIKFTPKEGDIYVDISAVGDSFIKISIRDTGIGMSEDIQSKIFSQGETVSTKGTNKEKGSGLGLKLCKEFIERNGGTIAAESTKGEGSTFSITIPTWESYLLQQEENLQN